MIVEPAPRSGTSGEQMDPSFIAVLQDSKLGRRQPSQPDSSIHVDMSPVEPAEAAEMLEMSEIGGSARNPHATAEPSEVPKPALQRGRYSLRFLLWFTVGTYVVGCMVVMGVLYLVRLCRATFVSASRLTSEPARRIGFLTTCSLSMSILHMAAGMATAPIG